MHVAEAPLIVYDSYACQFTRSALQRVVLINNVAHKVPPNGHWHAKLVSVRTLPILYVTGHQ